MMARNRQMKKVTVLLAGLLLCWATMVQAAVPEQSNYQGRLTDAAGVPLDGAYLMVFSLWDVDTGGADAIWYEQQTVTVTEGIYNVQLGAVIPFTADLFDESDRFLQVEIFTTGEGWEVLTPRQPLTSVPFAMHAADADTLEGKTVSQIHAEETDPTVDASVKDGVSWSEISDVPAGFADGIDNDSGGDITGVTAGTGLSGGGTSGNVTLQADTSFLQRRVGGGCPPGLSIRVINADGTVACELDDVGIISETDPQVGSNTLNYIPRWSGSALVTGSIFDNGSAIGIGTSSPSSRLEIEGVNPQITIDTIGAGTQAGLRFQKDASTKWQMSWNADSQYLYFWGAGTGTSMVLQDGTGNVGIGTGAPVHKLDVNGQIRAISAYQDSILLGGDLSGNDVEIGILAPAERNAVTFWNHQTGTFADIHSGHAFVSELHITSDSRLKTEISTIDNALDKISRMRGVEFEWRNSEFPGRGFGGSRKIGLIAQEVEQVLPEVVSTRDGSKGVEYANIVAILIEAVKELKDHNEALRKRLEAVEKRNLAAAEQSSPMSHSDIP